MDDYISRDYTVENMENFPWDTEHDKNAAIHLVRELVPAADVVEVVRCKDCTYFSHVKCQEERAGLCEHFDTYMYISDYCSDGYRRADNGK